MFHVLGRPQVDLFASHRNKQLPLWFCQTGHPLVATGSNAMSQSWTGLYVYAYPPFPLLERTLINIREDQAAEAILLAPLLPRMSWYHHLLQMACKTPLLLPRRRDLMLQHLPNKGVLYHTKLETIQLTAWTLSDKPSRTMDF